MVENQHTEGFAKDVDSSQALFMGSVKFIALFTKMNYHLEICKIIMTLCVCCLNQNYH